MFTEDLLLYFRSCYICRNPLDPKLLQKVNNAYEFLKADLEDTYEAYRDIKENMSYEVNAVSLNCSPECAYAIGMCSEQNNRYFLAI